MIKRSERKRARLVDAVVALQHRDFRRFFLAALVSNSGAWLQGVASPFVMHAITGSGAWVGVSVFATLLPMALMGPWAGPLADRLPRRQILLVAQSLAASTAFGFALLWWTGVRTPLPYVAMSAIYGIVNGFGMPAWQAYVADLVPRESLMNAITLNSAQFNAARAIGPSIGGIVLALVGPGWAFAGNALSFGAVVITLFSLPASQSGDGAERSHEPPLRQFRLGMGYARTQPGIMTAYLAATLVSVCGGTLVQVHLVLFAEDVFDASDFQFGLLVSAFGIGAMLMTPWLTTVAPQVRQSGVLVGGLVLYGAGELLLTATTVYVVGFLGVLVAGAAHITMATTTNSALQLQVADDMRGRVMAMYIMVLTLGMPIGAIIEGPLAEVFGVRAVVTVMGALMILGAFAIGGSGRASAFDVAEDQQSGTEQPTEQATETQLRSRP